MDRKKELKKQYMEMKPDMGVFIIRSKTERKCYIEATTDLRGRINGTKARLNGGLHINRELQKAWREQGQDSFTIGVAEILEYDKDESKTDYTDELALLQNIWEEKLLADKWELYKKMIK